MSNVYEKPYRMRVFKGNIAVSVPPEVIRKEAKKHKLSVDDFIKQFRLVAQYNSFEGIHYQFVKGEDNGIS